MPPKSAASAAPGPRQDLPWALGVLSNPEAEPIQLPAALTFLASLSPAQLPQETDAAVQLLTLATPFMCANDASASAAAIRLVTRLATEMPHDAAGMQEALRQPAVIQSLWAVPAYFHASFEPYVARLAAIAQEAKERPPSAPPTSASPAKKPDSRAAAKAAPLPPVDPESTLPGPSKYALDAAISALSAAVGPPLSPGCSGVEAAVADVVGRDVAPLLSLLKHHSSRIQVLSLRLLRRLLLLVRCEPLAASLAAAGAAGQLAGLLGSSPFGAVREEALLTLSRLLAANALAMQHSLDAGLPALLLKHILAPTTGVPVEAPPPPPPGQQPQQQSPTQPQSQAGRRASTPRGSHQGQAPSQGRPSTPSDGDQQAEGPSGPPPIDFSKPMISAPERLQELSLDLLVQLTEHHHGAAQELLRLGGLALLLALLPAPQLPELPPPPAKKRVSSASDTFFAQMMGRGRATGSGSGAAAAAPLPPRPKDAWQPFLDAPPTLPLPASRSSSPSLYAPLLRVVACLLAEPGVADWLWWTHPTRRHHLQLAFLLRADEPPKPEPPAPAPTTPSRRNTMVALEPPPPDPTQPPFSPEVRAAALCCLLQLLKHPPWLELLPSLAAFQDAVRDQAVWHPGMVAPMAEILQRILQKRLPPPPRAAAAIAAAGGGGAAADTAASVSERPRTAANPFPAPPPNGLPAEANGLAGSELSTEEATEALKALAGLARRVGTDPRVVSVVSSALLVLPDSAIFAPPWPPLPSPPPTPPPPPLPTSQYLWDALGRPVMTDGIKLVHL